MKVVKTRPTFTLVSPASTTLIPGTAVEVLRFRIAAHTDGDVALLSGTSNIRFTVGASGGSGTGTYTLYEAAGDIIVASSTTNVTNGTQVNMTFEVQTSTIPAGQSKEYYVKANLSSFTTTGNTFQLVVNNAAADFSWSDTSNVENPSISPDINNADFTGYGLPLTGPIYVKP